LTVLPEGCKLKPNARILVIDDDADMRALLDEMLTAAARIAQAGMVGRGGEISDRRADLVITDLCMPNQEGWKPLSNCV